MLLPQRATGDEHQQHINTSKKIGELDVQIDRGLEGQTTRNHENEWLFCRLE